MDNLIQPQDLFQKLHSDKPPVVIDVRDQMAFFDGHIPGARHIPGDELAGRLAEIPKDQLVVPY